jgi:hypothetical protein
MSARCVVCFVVGGTKSERLGHSEKENRFLWEHVEFQLQHNALLPAGTQTLAPKHQQLSAAMALPIPDDNRVYKECEYWNQRFSKYSSVASVLNVSNMTLS